MARTGVSEDDPIVRKVQIAGGSTFTVSLPKEWARSQSLESGSKLRLYALEDRVVVAPESHSPTGQSVTVDADGLGADALERRVRAAYTAGGTEIEVTASDDLSADQRRAATDALAGLVGVEVDHGSNGAVAARSMLDASAVSLEQTILQLRRLALTMYREAIESVIEDDADLAASVGRRTDDVDRFVALVGRQFHAALVDVGEIERLDTDRATAYRHHQTARYLGDVAHDAAAVASVAREQTGPPADAVAEPLRDLGSAIRAVLEEVLRDSPTAMGEGREDVTAALAAVDDGLAASDDPDAVRYGRLRERLARTVEAIDAIAAARSQAELVPAEGE